MIIAVLGDFCIFHDDVIRIDSAVIDLLSSCDYKILNYEAPLDDKKKHVVKKSGPVLKQHPYSVKLLETLGIDALALANNHIMDEGVEGFIYTSQRLSNFQTMGVGSWKEAYKVHIIEKDGVRIGFLNFCEMQFGMLYDEWNQTNGDVGCAWVNHPKVNQLIIDSKRNVDYLIAICHAGVENIELPLPEWRTRYRELVDLGCNAVVAHHPHVVQGYEIYKGSPIFYSLGNFYFPNKGREHDELWNTGAIAILSIDQNQTDFKLYGCKNDRGMLRLIDNEEWKIKVNELCELLQSDYVSRANKMCFSLLNQYWDLFAMGGLFNPHQMSVKNIGRVLLGRYNYIHVLNNIQCESHRWCVCRALRCLFNDNNHHEQI